MPAIKIEIIKGKSDEYKKALFEAVFEGLSNAISTPREKLTQRIFEWEEGNYDLAPGKSDKYTLIEVRLLPGRDAVLKKSIISEITRTLGELLQIPPSEILIIISDPPLENWGHGGLQALEW
ncbi:MAG: tautomerase family protein [Oscillospiraceae bacterium]|nr:tautomerase family protein [Oscillospiraceae bacterium]